MKRVRLSEVFVPVERGVTVVPTAAYQMVGVRSFGGGCFASGEIAGSQTRYPRLLRVEAGDLVYPKLMAWEGAFAFVPEELAGGWVSPEFCTFEVNESVADACYLHYFFRRPDTWLEVAGKSSGTNVRRRRLYPRAFLDQEANLPDLPEQREIATRLHQVLTRVGQAAEILERNAKLSDVLLEAIASEAIERISAPRRALGELASVTRGKGPKYDPDSDSPILNQACIKWDGLDLRHVKYVTLDWAQSVDERHRVVPNDVLVNSTGEGTLGRACVVTEPATSMPFDSHVLRVRADLDELEPRFLAIFLRSRQGQAAINAAKGATTTKQTELGKNKLEALLVPAPSLALQNEIAVTFARSSDRVWELKGRYEIAAREAAALWRSLLNRSFPPAA